MDLFTWQMIFLMVAINAFYVAAELSIVAVKKNKVQLLVEEGHPLAVHLLPLLEPYQRDRAIAACQIGITVTSLVLGAFGEARLAIPLAKWLRTWLDVDATASISISGATILLGLSAFQMVFGEQVPKSIALRSPVKTALYTAVLLRWSMSVMSVFIDVLNGAGLALLRLVGVERVEYRHVHAAREIELLLKESRQEGLIEPEEHVRLRRALRLGIRSARQLMIPISEVVAVDADATVDETLAVVSRCPYTRLPVYRSSMGQFIGLLHVKDVVAYRLEYGTIRSLSSLIRPLVEVQHSVKADELLYLLRERKSHLGVVVDAAKNAIGLITLEDVLAEVLGDIGDEFKTSVEGTPERLDEGRVRMPGSYPLEEVESWIGVPWQGKGRTVGAFLTEHIRAPIVAGQRCTIQGVEVEIERVARQRVVSVLLFTPHEGQRHAE